MWPKDVGIKAMELYFPAQYVAQEDLEEFDGVSAGKYTIGLGQSRMGFCTDREDINSLCLTVVSRLMDRYQINPKDVGRLEVGTETILDKSKSVKSVLMQLFEPSGATDIEGIDSTNACYGGTAALFNAIAWVESSAWDGRLAIVVAADNAVYAKGSARPTGGAGAIAMAIGPNAPLVFDRGLRASCMRHAYDFYKPDLRSEYPVVDGKLSIQCYLSALDTCYERYTSKAKTKNNDTISLKSFDSMLFHSPYGKLVQKSFARLAFVDFLQLPQDESTKRFPHLTKFQNAKLETTYFDRDIEKAFLDVSKQDYEKKTKPSLFVANLVGNMYTPSVYSGLVSLLISKPIEELAGNKVGIFSYGSGLASSMYSMRITDNCAKSSELARLIDNLKYVREQLSARQQISPDDYTRILDLREKNCHVVPYEPRETIEHMFPGTYYLVKVDELYRRTYKRVPVEK
ncbi:hydroxymethylglutaryl-CoA synthase 1 [Leptopilina heterotoma]|uniref:hydroxymethylglutaryl-CoA synthase 1 n=1 Tax=Leptopilina heterotoma TaxID=63436 RepID=UPI001CA7C066|nr:hydroxymethylglutaryl-CoA synthase 1 [Leptopilina heterotoma]XP_043463427.1 hydroxymethylglutaryl-CoA synthase 1 [Leptopilina heterotoma]XP_043463435.1 hydroxymethylglutaryl-CoA synthase 1 [Leptopilina heterotoma]